MQEPSEPATLHASHCRVQAFSQHRPSAQKVEEHSDGRVQGSPRALDERQTVPSHQAPATQSAEVAQVPRHSVGPQTYRSQEVVTGPGQLAAEPGQNACEVSVPAVQLASRQE